MCVSGVDASETVAIVDSVPAYSSEETRACPKVRSPGIGEKKLYETGLDRVVGR